MTHAVGTTQTKEEEGFALSQAPSMLGVAKRILQRQGAQLTKLKTQICYKIDTASPVAILLFICVVLKLLHTIDPVLSCLFFIGVVFYAHTLLVQNQEKSSEESLGIDPVSFLEVSRQYYDSMETELDRTLRSLHQPTDEQSQALLNRIANNSKQFQIRSQKIMILFENLAHTKVGYFVIESALKKNVSLIIEDGEESSWFGLAAFPETDRYRSTITLGKSVALVGMREDGTVVPYRCSDRAATLLHELVHSCSESVFSRLLQGLPFLVQMDDYEEMRAITGENLLFKEIGESIRRISHWRPRLWDKRAGVQISNNEVFNIGIVNKLL